MALVTVSQTRLRCLHVDARKGGGEVKECGEGGEEWVGRERHAHRVTGQKQHMVALRIEGERAEEGSKQTC